jgi:hypothetical protein
MIFFIVICVLYDNNNSNSKTEINKIEMKSSNSPQISILTKLTHLINQCKSLVESVRKYCKK